MERDFRNIYQKEVFSFSGRGEVWSYSIMYDAATDFVEFLPYVVALVKTEEGPMITAQITDVNIKEVYIGMKVEMVTRVLSRDGKRGLIRYGYKFRPPIESVEPSGAGSHVEDTWEI